MKVIIDPEMREYLNDHGIRIAKDGFLTISKQQAKRLHFEKSVRRPGVRTLVIPSRFGETLLFEGQHFVIQ